MHPWLGSALLFICFLACLKVFNLIESCKKSLKLTHKSFSIISNKKLGDEEKEKALQEFSKQFIYLFVIISLGTLASLAIPYAVLLSLSSAGWLDLNDVITVSVSPLFISVSSALIIIYIYTKRTASKQNSDYTILEKVLHYVAFYTSPIQIEIADLEDKFLSKRSHSYLAEKPVFITSLPRAGTTLLLNIYSESNEFATHRYRDMPFVLIPYFWSRITSTFQLNAPSRERAHKDGVYINYDSPEALEEILWKSFWKEHYKKDCISPWTTNKNSRFQRFFKSHMRKLIYIRNQQNSHARYVSKNNSNIARISLLRQQFPDSTIIIPFRDPIEHAHSLLNQHLNFLDRQDKDPFTLRYMSALGHHDFGMDLRPINFSQWYINRDTQDSRDLAFWLEYWLASYKQLLKENDEVVLISYEMLCNEPRKILTQLAHISGVQDIESFIASAPAIHPPHQKKIDTSEVSGTLIEQVYSIHSKLLDNSLR